MIYVPENVLARVKIPAMWIWSTNDFTGIFFGASSSKYKSSPGENSEISAPLRTTINSASPMQNGDTSRGSEGGIGDGVYAYTRVRNNENEHRDSGLC